MLLASSLILSYRQQQRQREQRCSYCFAFGAERYHNQVQAFVLVAFSAALAFLVLLLSVVFRVSWCRVPCVALWVAIRLIPSWGCFKLVGGKLLFGTFFFHSVFLSCRL